MVVGSDCRAEIGGASTLRVMTRAGIALVIGSCRAPQERPWLGLAQSLATTLTAHPRDGWRLHGGAPLLDPDVHTVKNAITEAVAAADRDRAALLLSYIGHGATDDSSGRLPGFFLQVKDAPEALDEDTGINLGLLLRRKLMVAPSVDGVILLIDACSAGALPGEAITNWRNVTGGRLEILVASGPETTDKAYDGCFTNTLLTTLTTGVGGRGDNLHLIDLLPPIAQSCTAQQATYVGFANGGVNAVGIYDEGLWLTGNLARTRHCLIGHADAGILDDVTRHVTLSLAQRRAQRTVTDRTGSRLRWVVGPAGAGKTTLMATLIRPPGRVAQTMVSAAAFLDVNSTSDVTSRALAAQLTDFLLDVDFKGEHARVAAAVKADPGNPEWARSVDVELIHPLIPILRTNPDLVIEMILDGLDQVAPGNRAGFDDLIHTLTSHPDLEQVRLIVGTRTPPPPPIADHAAIDTLRPPTWNDIAATIPNDAVTAALPHGTDGDEPAEGGWLTGRIAALLAAPPPSATLAGVADAFIQQALDRLPDADREPAEGILAILALAGLGPVMPIGVLEAALTHLGRPLERSHLRTLIIALLPLIQRGRSGTDDEHLGIAHQEIATLIYNQLPQQPPPVIGGTP